MNKTLTFDLEITNIFVKLGPYKRNKLINKSGIYSYIFMTKEKEGLDKLYTAYNQKFNALKNKDQILKIEFDLHAKFSINDILASVQEYLTKKDPEERILKSGFDLEGYIYESIRNKKKDIHKHEQTKLKAYILHPGDYVVGYKEFKKGKEYNLRDVKEYENQQLGREKETIKYNLRIYKEVPLGQGTNKDDENSKADFFIGKWSIQDFEEKENKKDMFEILSTRINQLSTNCKNLLNEFKSRKDPSITLWAKEKGVDYSNLKLNFHRCIKKARELGFNEQSQTA